MRAVNLLPKDDGRPRGPEFRNNPLVIGGVVGAVLVTAVLAAMFLTASTAVADNQKDRDAAAAQLAATPVPPPPPPGASELEQEKGARIGALSAALSGRLAWDRVLREVSLVLPEDVWLSSLSATAPVAASPTTTAGFSINGTTALHACSRASRWCPSCRTSSSCTARSRRARRGARWSSSRSTRP
jgi:Tfp pilus assembly protein PilN